MSYSIIIIAEGNHLFGFEPTKFSDHFPLNEIWISPVLNNDKIWNFEKKDGSLSGILVNLNQILNSSQVFFRYSGSVFTIALNGESDTNFGFFCNQIVSQITLEEKDKRVTDIDTIKHKPENISEAAITKVVKYKRKNVFVIDPHTFFEQQVNY